LLEIQSHGSGVGIRGIRERIRQFHGEMKIESNGSGTSVIVTIPMPNETRLAEGDLLPVAEKMVSAEGIESTLKRSFNKMQVSG
jgi:hypothetical protein